ESELQEELKLIKKYYPYAVETEESKPSTTAASSTSESSATKEQTLTEPTQDSTIMSSPGEPTASQLQSQVPEKKTAEPPKKSSEAPAQSDASAKPAASEPKLALTKEGKDWKTIVDPKTALSESAIQSGSTLCGRIVRVMRIQLLEALKDRRTRYQDFGRTLPFKQAMKQQPQTGVGETGAPKQ
ncbi:MAG: hypothetical protein J6U42_00500, partial [Lachnospiraceae bacterium]|nr:hypothetical protein [Lachnospiraceae bacterium]